MKSIKLLCLVRIDAGFIPPDLQPLNSPAHRLVEVWAEQDHRHIAAAIEQGRRCLNACDTCEKAEWRYFEQNLL